MIHGIGSDLEGSMQSCNESSPWMALTLSPEGLITSISSAAEQFTGYSAHDLVGRPVTDILGDPSVFEIPQMMKSALDWGVWDGDLVVGNRSGIQARAHGSLVPLATRQSGCSGFLMLLDIRQGPAVDSAGAPLLEVGAHLRRTFHELNNPLAVVMGFTQLILLDPHCDGKTRADVERVYAEMKRVIQIVEKLHVYALSLQEVHSEVEQVSLTG